MVGDNKEKRYECPHCHKLVNAAGQGHLMQCVLFGTRITPPPPPSGKTGVLAPSGPKTRCLKCGNMVAANGVGPALKCAEAGKPVQPPA